MSAPTPPAPLEISKLRPEHGRGLLELFEVLKAQQEDTLFSPHPFTREHVEWLSQQPRSDLYYVLHTGDFVLGYGLLRGWDEGYPVPSLGIAIHPDHRGRGLAPVLMSFLHAAAAVRGAQRVRLRVHQGNDRAIQLYRRQGYAFDERPDAAGLLVAYKALDR